MTKPKTVWITYAWADNKTGDVDYVEQELKAAGINVERDLTTIRAGEALWPQIEDAIQNPERSDAWLMFATSQSLESKPCKEEYLYALDRALNKRVDNFPVMAIFPGPVENSLIPAGIRVRLHVSLTDRDWKERVIAAVEGRAPAIRLETIDPYSLVVHDLADTSIGGGYRFGIEMRPRAGTWAPFLAAIPVGEFEAVQPMIFRQPAGGITSMQVARHGGGEEAQGEWYLSWLGEEATPTMSIYMVCKALPSKLLFGVKGKQPQYTVFSAGTNFFVS